MNTPHSIPIIYVTRDLERALGLPLDTPGYFIISNFTPFAKLVLSEAKGIAKNRKNILLIKSKEMLDTWELLQRVANPDPPVGGERSLSKEPPEAQKRDSSIASLLRNGQLVVFKNTLQIEKICADNGWKLLNPPAKLSNHVEEKISQLAWLGPLKKYLPEYKVLKCKNIKLKTINNCFLRSEDCLSENTRVPQRVKNNYLLFKPPFILQFNRSHTGSGTILIESEKQLKEIQKKFPEREARIAEYIPGPLFTNNNVVTNVGVMIGNISYQITGLKPFTDLPFSTIGNDWALPHKILTKKQITRYKKIATDVGLRLKKAGWKGLFGIDVVADEKNGELYLVEINCRQPASAAYESQLQNEIRNKEIKKLRNYELTTFEAHVMSLLGMDLKNKKLTEIGDGSQIIQRVNQSAIKNLKSKIGKLSKQFNVIQYNNTEPNSDLLRIQSKTGIMKKHNEFNPVGEKIVKLISKF